MTMPPIILSDHYQLLSPLSPLSSLIILTIMVFTMNCLLSTDGLLFHNLMTVAPVRGGHMSHEVTHYCALMQEVTGSMMMLGRYHHTSY